MSNSFSRNNFMTPAVKQRWSICDNTSTVLKPPRPSSVFAHSSNAPSPIARDFKDAKSDTFEVEKAYNKYLKSLLADILVDEATEKETTEIDWKMAELAKRFEMNKVLLEKTNRRLKDISFQSEQQRLQDMRELDVRDFMDYIDCSNPCPDLNDLLEKQKAYLNQLKLDNVTVGDNATDGCKELHDTLVDTIAAFEDIKKNLKLSEAEFEKYRKMSEALGVGVAANDDMADIRKAVESILPSINEDVLRETSESLHRFKLYSDEEEDDDEDTPVHDCN